MRDLLFLASLDKVAQSLVPSIAEHLRMSVAFLSWQFRLPSKTLGVVDSSFLFCSISFFLQLYEEFLKETSILTAFLLGILVVMTSRRIPVRPTAPTLDRQNPSAKAVWGTMGNCSHYTGPQFLSFSTVASKQNESLLLRIS